MTLNAYSRRLPSRPRRARARDGDRGYSEFAYRAAETLAPAKLNLRLHVLGRREDGYHFLDSLVVPIRLFDRVQLQLCEASAPEVSVVCRPRAAAPRDASNLAVRAAQLFLERAGLRAAVRIRLTKRIPAGAGLGGGSSDAAAVLRLLNAMVRRPVPGEILAYWALSLGADVPFFLLGTPARMRGIGERLEAAAAVGRGPVVVAYPGLPLATKAVYERLDSLTLNEAASRIRPPTNSHRPASEDRNDLEAAALQLLPRIRELKQRLRALGGRGVLMTGSGSAVFGFWDRLAEARAAARELEQAGIWAKATWLLDQVSDIKVQRECDGRSPSW